MSVILLLEFQVFRTKIAVNILSPICRLNAVPIQLITTIIIPPKIELIINFIIIFIGNTNIFPNKIIEIIHPKKISTVHKLIPHFTNTIIMLVFF